MNRYISFLLIGILAKIAPVAAQENAVPFSITISAAGDVFKSGAEVKIRLVFRNISRNEIPYVRGLGTGVERQGELFSDVEVRDAKGDLVPETKYYRVLRGKPDTSASPAASGSPGTRWGFRGSFTGVMLKPGESREEDIVVSKLYDLSHSGQY